MKITHLNNSVINGTKIGLSGQLVILLICFSIAAFSQEANYDGICNAGSDRNSDFDCVTQDFPNAEQIILKDTSYYSEVVYIDPTYQGSENGSFAQPYNSWTDITFVSNVAYLQKKGTTYSSSSSIEIPSNVSGILLGSYGSGEKPIISCNVERAVHIFGANTTIRDLHIKGPGDNINAGITVYLRGSADRTIIYNCEISSGKYGIFSWSDNNRIINTTVHTQYLDGIWAAQFSFLEISNSHIYNVNTAYRDTHDQEIAGGDGVQLEHDWEQVWIHHNIIDRSNSGNKFCVLFNSKGDPVANKSILEYNELTGPKYDLDSDGGASINCNGGENYTIQYNTFNAVRGTMSSGIGIWNEAKNDSIIGNTFHGYNIAIRGATAEGVLVAQNTFHDNVKAITNSVAYLKNNIFSSSSENISLESCSLREASNNLFYGSDPFGSSYIVGNPSFINANVKDFRLSATSEAIDQGTPLAYYKKDKDGQIISGNYDIGAYEYAPTNQIANNPPVINNQEFSITEAGFSDGLIGNIFCLDEDPGQVVSLSIIEGDDEGLFYIDDQRNLYANDNSIFSFEPDEYLLTVEAKDDSPAEATDEATIKVVVHKLVSNNTAPVIENQELKVLESDYSASDLGKVAMSDPDEGQSHAFSIEAGNEAGLFSIDASTGQIGTNSTNLFLQSEDTFTLTVRVEDEPGDADEAEISILLIRDMTVFIDPENVNDALEDGSKQHPFDSWEDVEWMQGKRILQKRGTVAHTNKLSIGSNDITIGAYGTGDEPVIWSSSEEYALRIFEKSDVTVQNLRIIAENAISGIYLLGDNCDNITVEHTKIEGSIYGVRILGGKNFAIRYSTFRGNSQAIYSYAENTKVYYNVFENNQYGVNIDGTNSNAELYNNVFYDNNTSVTSDYASLTLHNNIFYMTKAGDKAVYHGNTKLVSDYNIYYPEQEGLISYNSIEYTSLAEFKQTAGLDSNSFTSDPLFQDIFNHDYSINRKSPAINTGVDVGITSDLIGRAVPFGNKPDIGVVESNEEGSELTVLNADKEINSTLQIYPNPTTGVVRVNCKEDFESGILKVLDINGQVIREKSFSKVHVTSSPYLNISDLPSGIYIIVLELPNSIYSQKVIKE